MRRAIVIFAGVVLALMLAALYALVFAMSTGADEIGFSFGVSRVSISLSKLAFALLLLAPLVAAFIALMGLPKRIAEAGRRRRREKGVEALETALVAAAAGDGRTARREASRAETLLGMGRAPRVIAAQSAEEMGDVVGAEAHYAAMLGDGRTELAGRRGLAATALTRGDFATAIAHASQALLAHPESRWAFELLFDAQVRSYRWADAVDTLAKGVRRKHVAEPAARRRRAVLMSAQAATLERIEPQRARELAEAAAQTSPAFAPGVALAARLLAKADKTWRAASLIEDAWRVAPHPALALAFKDLKPDEPAPARAKRMASLAALNPDHRESAILLAEQALEADDAGAARAALKPVLADERSPTARLCGLMGRIAQAAGQAEEARDWLRQATLAPGEPDWSDLDPDGPAFAYESADWARLVYSYGDSGALIHPRHERFERHALPAPDELLLEAPKDEAPAEATPSDPAQPAAAQSTASPKPPERSAPAAPISGPPIVYGAPARASDADDPSEAIDEALRG